MKKNCLILFICIFFANSLDAQKYFNNWYFGDKAGITFNTSPPSALTNSQMKYKRAGCSSISDSLGNLLFYTSGDTIWNRNHVMMKNGYGLFGHNGSTQAALIVKQPGNSNIFYVFTTDNYTIYKDSNVSNRGVNYSVVDINKDNGLGEVIVKNVLLFENSSEKISAVTHSNGKDIWISSIKKYTDSIFIYKLTESGLSLHLNYKTGYKVGTGIRKWGVGYMKFSPKGNLLAYSDCDDSSYILLFNFNKTTGTLSNSRRIYSNDWWPSVLYGLEFSPNEKYLYVVKGLSGYGRLFQMPIKSIFNNVKFEALALQINKKATDKIAGALQLAPDGKIYVAMYDTCLSVINQPDNLGSACDLKMNAVFLKGGKCRLGLPNCVQSLIYIPLELLADTACMRDSVIFTLKGNDINSVLWNFGNGDTKISKTSRIKYLYKDSGTYSVSAKVTLNNGSDTLIYSKIRIEYIPSLNFSKDTMLCAGDTLPINFANPWVDQYLWENGFQKSQRVIKQSGQYTIERSNAYCRTVDSFVVSYGKKPAVYLGNDTAFCHKFSFTLDAGKDFNAYQWNTGDTSYLITVNSKGQYSVKVYDSLYCSAGDTIALDELVKGKISSTLDTVTCEYVVLSLKQQKGVSYQWSTNDTGAMIKVKAKGLYSVKSSNNFCSVTDSILVDLLPKPAVYLGPDTLICNSITLSTSEKGKYLWNEGQQTPTISVNKPGEYWLKISRNQCESSDTIKLNPCDEYLYFIPNAFSPNNDSNNDYFKVYGTNVSIIQMKIFNLWGEIIFDSKGGSDDIWDGVYQNAICPQGVYCYFIEFNIKNEKHFVKGFVHLIR
ncbi:MAG: gliding motility-associated C-terminal domain-containing protein [Bacteroidota bacterium]